MSLSIDDILEDYKRIEPNIQRQDFNDWTIQDNYIPVEQQIIDSYQFGNEQFIIDDNKPINNDNSSTTSNNESTIYEPIDNDSSSTTSNNKPTDNDNYESDSFSDDISNDEQIVGSLNEILTELSQSNITNESVVNDNVNNGLSLNASAAINKFISNLSFDHAFLKNYQYLIYQYFMSEHFKDKNLLVLWMTVGSGKTLLSISCGIAGLKTGMFERVVILCPKSIQDEFRKNLLLYCSLSNPPTISKDRLMFVYKSYLKHFHLIAYNSWAANREFQKIPQLNNSLFIIDEAHLFTKAVMKTNLTKSDLKNRKLKHKGNAFRIYTTIKSLSNKKILALTGTPSSKVPFEMVPMFNLAYKKNLFTTDMSEWSNYYIDYDRAEIKHKDELIKKLDGLIAYVPRPITSTSVRATELQIVNVEMSYNQYRQYLIDYKKELDEYGDSPHTNMYGFKYGKVSSYHTKTFEDCVYWNEWLKNKNRENRLVGKVHDVNDKHCPKIIKMYEDSTRINGTCVFYFRFTSIYGIQSMTKLLERKGFKPVKAKENVFENGKRKRYAVFSGDESMQKRNRMKDMFNDKLNRYGEYIKYLILSPSGSVGITLKNVRYLGIGSVDFVYATIRQILGRCNRLDSHVDLPERDRTLVNKLYLMTKNEKYFRENKLQVLELCTRKAPGINEQCPTIEKIIYADALYDDQINEDFKNKVLIPASITEKVYKDFNKKTKR